MSERSGAASLAPVVDGVDPRAVIARFVRPVHADTLDLCPEAGAAHRAVGFVPPQTDAGIHAGQAPGAGETDTGAKQIDLPPRVVPPVMRELDSLLGS